MNTGKSISARICGASTVPVEDDHPVEWLRGKHVIEVVVDDASGVTIGDEVVVVTKTAMQHHPMGDHRCSCGWEGDSIRIHMADTTEGVR